MIPLFLYPLGLLGLLAVPALVAIYLFRNRFRRYPVSSLMLWLDAREAREGGTRLRRLQTPLLFLLELLALLLLALAAAEPFLRMRQGTRPLVVVLDDSFSMQAGGNAGPRAQAIAALREELNRHMPSSVRFVLAGAKPQLLGEPVRSAREALALVEQWGCHAPSARLDEAVSLAGELGGELSLLLVLTDHPPPEDALPAKGRLRWWSFGAARENAAIVNAARTWRDGRDRVLLEIANLSDAPATRTLTIAPVGDGPLIRRSRLELTAGETHRMILQLADKTPAIRARLDDDPLAIDNAVVLQPPIVRPVRVEVGVSNPRLRQAITKALGATGQATIVTSDPELRFTDEPAGEANDGTWVVRLLVEKDATAFAGPFILDRAHPLCQGLSLRGIVWGAGKSTTLDGAPVVLVGNVPLLTDSETITPAGPRHELRLRLRPELSTLPDAPDWPILMWNIVHWRGQALPGLTRVNARLGEQVVLNLGTFRDRITLQSPDEEARTLPVRGREIAVKADRVGIYTLTSEDQTYTFAVNALDRDESDLRGCKAGQWGDWLDEKSIQLEYQGVAWLLLLVLLGVVVLHLLLLSRSGSTGPSREGRVRL